MGTITNLELSLKRECSHHSSFTTLSLVHQYGISLHHNNVHPHYRLCKLRLEVPSKPNIPLTFSETSSTLSKVQSRPFAASLRSKLTALPVHSHPSQQRFTSGFGFPTFYLINTAVDHTMVKSGIWDVHSCVYVPMFL